MDVGCIITCQVGGIRRPFGGTLEGEEFQTLDPLAPFTLSHQRLVSHRDDMSLVFRDTIHANFMELSIQIP